MLSSSVFSTGSTSNEEQGIVREPTMLGDLPQPPADPDRQYIFYRDIMLEFCNISLQEYFAFNLKNIEMMNRYIYALWGYENSSLTKEQAQDLIRHSSPNTWFSVVFLWPLSNDLMSSSDQEYRMKFTSQAGLAFLERVIQIDAYVSDDGSLSPFSESSSHHLHLVEQGDFWNFGSVSGDTWYGLMWGLGVVDFEAYYAPGYLDSSVKFVVKYIWQWFDLFGGGWKTETQYSQYNTLNLPIIGSAMSIVDDDTTGPQYWTKLYWNGVEYETDFSSGYVFEYSSADSNELKMMITDISWGVYRVYVNNQLEKSDTYITSFPIWDLNPTVFSITTQYLETKYGLQDEYKIDILSSDGDNDRPNDNIQNTFQFIFKRGTVQPPPVVSRILGEFTIDTHGSPTYPGYNQPTINYKTDHQKASIGVDVTFNNPKTYVTRVLTRIEIIRTANGKLGVTPCLFDTTHRKFNPDANFHDVVQSDILTKYVIDMWVQLNPGDNVFDEFLLLSILDTTLINEMKNLLWFDLTDWIGTLGTLINPSFGISFGLDMVNDIINLMENQQSVTLNRFTDAYITFIPLQAFSETTPGSGVFDNWLSGPSTPEGPDQNIGDYAEIATPTQEFHFTATETQVTAANTFIILELISDIVTTVGTIMIMIGALTSWLTFGTSLTVVGIGMWLCIIEFIMDAIKWIYYWIANYVDPTDQNIEELAPKQYFTPPPIPGNVLDDPIAGPLSQNMLDSFVDLDANLIAVGKTENKINTAINSTQPNYDGIVTQMAYESDLLAQAKESNEILMDDFAVGMGYMFDMRDTIIEESNKDPFSVELVDWAQDNVSESGLPQYEQDLCNAYRDFHDDDLYTQEKVDQITSDVISLDPESFTVIKDMDSGLSLIGKGSSDLYSRSIDDLSNEIYNINIDPLKRNISPIPLTEDELNQLLNLKTAAKFQFDRKNYKSAYAIAAELKEYAYTLKIQKSNAQLDQYIDTAQEIMVRSEYYQQLYMEVIGSSQKVVKPGHSVEFDILVTNKISDYMYHQEELDVEISLEDSSLPAGWQYQFTSSGSPITSIHFSNIESKRIKLIITPPDNYPGELNTYNLKVVGAAITSSSSIFDTEDLTISLLDDDDSPPTIEYINFQATYLDSDNQITVVTCVADPSGIYQVILESEGMEYIGSTLDGHFFEIIIPNPVILGMHEFTLRVSDNDNDRSNDRSEISSSFQFEINDDDRCYPVIQWFYTGDYTDGNPGSIDVDAFDPINGDDYGLAVDPSGIYTVQNLIETDQIFTFTASDNDNEQNGIIPDDSLSTTVTIPITLTDDDISGPAVIINILEYSLFNTGGIQVLFEVVATDLESSVDLTSIDIWAANQHFTTLGTHTIVVDEFKKYSITTEVKNADLDRGSIDQETSKVTLHFDISNEIVKNLILDEIEDMRVFIQSTSDTNWRCPATFRKYAINEKLEDVKELIALEQYTRAYNVLLHDVKPKLTGLKTTEDEVAWGCGTYRKPWVTNSVLQENFRDQINSILWGINILAKISPKPQCHNHDGGFHSGHYCNPYHGHTHSSLHVSGR